jgi:single-strand DNA-binding protein
MVAVRSLNKAQLIGNLTRDPELRYTPQGTAVCTFGLATNRQWTTETGEKREEADFHRVVAWNKLAELCAQLLTKGRKVYIEGRLQTRNWTAQDGTQRQTTEIVASDMILLDSRRPLSEEEISSPPGEATESEEGIPTLAEPAEVTGAKGGKKTSAKQEAKDEKADGDIPF